MHITLVEETREILIKQLNSKQTDLESNLVRLMNDINSGTYEIGPSTVFIVDKPV